jgi:hypothetical protein
VRKSGANLRYKRHNSFIGQQAKRQLGVESGGRAPVAIYCASVSPNLRCVSANVRHRLRSVSDNVRRKRPSIARLPHFDCASLHLARSEFGISHTRHILPFGIFAR